MIQRGTLCCFLLLQLELGRIQSETPFVMTGLSRRLMVTPKERPGQGVSVRDRLLKGQSPGQAKHFWQGVGNQLMANPLRHLKLCKLLGPGFGSQAFFPCSALAWSIVSVAQNWATSERVMCRYQPIQDLTSY